MIAIRQILVLTLCFIVVSSFSSNHKYSYELAQNLKLEKLALKKNIIGKIYISDLTHIKDCNKSRIEYLGIAHTKNGKTYKILTSFFVFSTSNDMCHGKSAIKIYDLKNRYIGSYKVGMPESLPDSLDNNKLIYLENSKDCNRRNARVINLQNGLPKQFFIPCSKNGGDFYSFE